MKYIRPNNNNRGSFGSLTTNEVTMYKVRYNPDNNRLWLTNEKENVRYSFDATTTKLLDLKRAIKNNTLEHLPHSKFKKYKHLWIYTPV